MVLKSFFFVHLHIGNLFVHLQIFKMQVGGQNGVRLLLLTNKLVFMSSLALVEFARYVPLAELRASLELDDEGLELTEGALLEVRRKICGPTSANDSDRRRDHYFSECLVMFTNLIQQTCSNTVVVVMLEGPGPQPPSS